jgi:hypothetical protein
MDSFDSVRYLFLRPDAVTKSMDGRIDYAVVVTVDERRYFPVHGTCDENWSKPGQCVPLHNC